MSASTMSIADIERRLSTLEQTVEQLKSSTHQGAASRRWWVEDAGRFADDPLFDEIVRRGETYRQSLRPKPGKGKA